MPPTIELFTKFFQRYSTLARSTRARYYYVFSAFFLWYSGEKIPFEVKSPKLILQNVPDQDVDRVLVAIKNKGTRKKLLERDKALLAKISG